MISKKPHISVILPTFNRPRLLAQALESLAAQEFRDFEVLVVNDCGEDIGGVVDSFRAGLPEIQVLNHETNRGLPAARNTALFAARGEWIGYLDDDDLYYPQHLVALYEAASTKTPTAWFTGYWYSESREQNGVLSERSRTPIPYAQFDREKLLFENFVAVPCVFHPKSYAVELGGFDEHLCALEDWDLWLRMSRLHSFELLPVRNCEVRLISDTDSISGAQNQGYAWAALNALYKYFPFVQEQPRHGAQYRSKVTEGLAHLSALTLEAIGNGTQLRAFGRKEIACVPGRLRELEAFYGTDTALFAELRGLVYLYLHEIDLSRKELTQAASLGPGREVAGAVLGWLEQKI